MQLLWEKRLAFAKCFIDVSAAEPLTDKVALEMQDSTQVKLPAEYEWEPPRCENRSSFGHFDSRCPVPKWVPEKKPDNAGRIMQTLKVKIKMVVHLRFLMVLDIL